MTAPITPHHPDTERAVLSCCLQWPETIERVVSEPLQASLFFVPAHRILWNTMREMHAENEPLDLITLNDRLTRRNQLEQVGGPRMVAELIEDAPTVSLLPEYLKSILRDTKHRQLITTCNDIIIEAHDPESDIISLIQTLDTEVRRMLDSAHGDTIIQWNEALSKGIVAIEERYKLGGELPGISTGLKELDERTNGYQEGQLWVLGARPGAGKTAFALQQAIGLAKRETAVGIFSAEMQVEELVVRALSAESGIDGLRLAKGEVQKNEFQKISLAVARQNGLPIYTDDQSGMTLLDIQLGTRRLTREHGVKVIFVDYLQLIKGSTNAWNREDDVRRLSNGLKDLAKELKITVVALAQLNRDSEKRNDNKPLQSDLRDSGSIEQDANVIGLLHKLPDDRDEEYPEVDIDFILAKCRGGRPGTIHLSFERPTTTFTEKPNY